MISPCGVPQSIGIQATTFIDEKISIFKAELLQIKEKLANHTSTEKECFTLSSAFKGKSRRFNMPRKGNKNLQSPFESRILEILDFKFKIEGIEKEINKLEKDISIHETLPESLKELRSLTATLSEKVNLLSEKYEKELATLEKTDKVAEKKWSSFSEEQFS